MGSFARCSAQVVSKYFQVIAMIFLLALVSSGLASPIDRYEAKNPELRALLESGGPADLTGSWTPNLTPEVKFATKFFIDQYNTVELGGLEQLQAKQIPMHTSPTPPRWPQPRKRSTPPSRPPRWGSTQRLPQSTTTFRQVRLPTPTSTTQKMSL